MKRKLILYQLLTAALLLSGCGAMTEYERPGDAAAAGAVLPSESEIIATATAAAEEQTLSPAELRAASDERQMRESEDFQSITDEEALERLYSTLPNASYIADYHVPAGSPDQFRIFVPKYDGDGMQEIPDSDTPADAPDENAFYGIAASPDANGAPQLVLKQFTLAGNGYAHYKGEMDAESILTNFDYLTHDKKLLKRWFVDDPDIKCVAYDFFAIEDKGDGTAELGWYCYLIDRDDHLVSLQPDWNQKRTIELGNAPADRQPSTEGAELTEQELADMRTADDAVQQLIDSDEWRQANADTRRVMAVQCLYSLADQGLVIRESILDTEDTVSCQYRCGISFCIKLTPFDPRMN